MLKLYNSLSWEEEVFRPWKMNWYQLRDNELLKLEDDLLKKLIKSGIKQAGSLSKLCKSIGMCYTDFWYTLNDKTELVSVKKLRLLSAYLKIEYNYFNDKICEIRKGKVVSIRNPKFPFNLANEEGASLLGNIVSDGCIYIDKKARNIIRTKYSAGTKEELESFVNKINRIFGKVHFQKEKSRNSIYLKIGSSIIGESLHKVGAPLGNKSAIDPEIPWLIKKGSEKLKRAYLRTVFDDEGTPAGSGLPYLTLSRAIHIDKYLGMPQRRLLEKVRPFMKEHSFPTGHKVQSIELTKLKRLIDLNDKKFSSLLELLLKIKPRLLIDESKILASLGIHNRIRNSNLTITTNGKHSLKSELRIYQKAAVQKFYREINFGLSSKREKLQKFLVHNNWLQYAS